MQSSNPIFTRSEGFNGRNANGNQTYPGNGQQYAGHGSPSEWSVGTPGIGDWVSDGRLEVAQVTRDGRLHVWRAQGRATAAWARAGCDQANTGSCTN